MYRTLKKFFLHLSKWLGLFRISKYITRNALRILCYHNFSTGDELSWQPGLFIHPATFQNRMKYLKKAGYAVLELERAIELLPQKKLPNNSVVITIDDGWYNISLFAHQVLSKNSFPYTIYLTSYYSEKQTPIFNLIVPYMFWKTKKERINLEIDRLPIKKNINLTNNNKLQKIINQIIEYGQTQLNHDERCSLTKRLGNILEIDYSEIERMKIFNLLSKPDLTYLHKAGVDIQLHTHRHKWPIDKRAAIKELSDNRSYLKPISPGSLHHFCYPSGFWRPEQLRYLSAAKILSATTCDRGFNYAKTNLLLLKRFLDSEYISQIEFEAELNGYLEIYRNLRKYLMFRF